MLRRRTVLGGLALVLAGRSVAQPAQAVQVYAAMTFRPALDRVLAAYRSAGGGAVGVYAPTPVLVRQLAGGAPADILLTADPMWMDQAEQQGLIDPASRSNLLTNDLVLAAAPGTPPAGTISAGFALESLLGGGRIAMCDPDHDPAGRYAKQSLLALGLWPSVEPHIAIAESAPAAVTLVDRGEVRAAIAFRTDLHGDEKAMIVGTFPPDSHAPIVYPIALTRTPGPGAANALAFLRSPAAFANFAAFGYRSPD